MKHTLAPEDVVIIEGLKNRFDLNGLSGKLVASSSTDRWGVLLHRGGPPIAVRRDNLRLYNPPPSLLDRHSCHLWAVEKAFADVGLKSRVWQFLRQSYQLALKNPQVADTNLELTSLQIGQVVQTLHWKQGQVDDLLLCFMLKGPGIVDNYWLVACLPSPLEWDILDSQASPRYVDKESGQWLTHAGSKCTFCPGHQGTRFLAVASLEGRWAAYVSHAGDIAPAMCVATEIFSGNEIGTIFLNEAPTDAVRCVVMVAHGQILLRCAATCIQPVRICCEQPGVSGAEVVKLPQVVCKGQSLDYFSLALHDLHCAYIDMHTPELGGPLLKVHGVGKEGLSVQPLACISPHSFERFVVVKLTHDMIITLESDISQCSGELVVRDVLQPMASPLLKMQWPPTQAKHAHPWPFCGTQLLDKAMQLISAGAKEEDQEIQMHSRAAPRSEDVNHGVIEHVVHREPAAEITREEARLLEQEQRMSWARSQVDSLHLPQLESGATVMPTATNEFEKLFLLRFTRHPQALEERLYHGPELEGVRWTMERSDCSVRLASGGTILVYPGQYLAAKRVVAPLHLGHQHVIVSEAFAPLVLEAIQSLASRLKVRLRSMDILAYVDTSQSGGEDVFIVERTFLDGPPALLRNSWSVTQSTTEVHGSSNPRRVLAEP